MERGIKSLHIILWFSALGVRALHAQGGYYAHSLDSVADSFWDHSVFMLGENHLYSEQSFKFIEEIIAGKVADGSKEVGIFFEYPPSLGFWVQRYQEILDSAWTNGKPICQDSIEAYYPDFPIYIPISSLFDSLHTYHDSVRFTFIPLDVEFGRDFWLMKRMHYELRKHISPQNRLTPRYRIVNDLFNAHRRKKVKKMAEAFMADSSLQAQYQEIILPRYWYKFKLNMSAVAKYGFMHGGVSRKKLAIRDQHMASIIDSNCHNFETSIMLFGRRHITPYEENLLPDLITYMKKVKREDVLLIPIEYPNDELFSGIYYGEELYENESELSILVQKGIFDLILRVYDE